uniref:Pseudouridine synthase n=1 Tax=Loigolactobacillus rennini TaxID=238013 RepID=A0A1K2I7E3_9LACO|nr:Similar to ribosomal large subunit pseudouridine synthase D, Bacillus subtilis YhcT type [Loigolactobacillus rennini]
MQSWHYQTIINASQNGHTLRQYMRNDILIPKTIYHALRVQRAMTLNGHYQSVNNVVHTGDKINLTFTAADFNKRQPHYVPDNTRQIPILYENKDLLVANKPAGIKTHPNQPYETGTLMNYLTAYLAQAPYIVHRLDMATSGAILVAKNPVVVPILNRLLSQKKITRQYFAWVHGHLPSQGTINLAIGRDIADKRKRQVAGIQAVNAVTHYQSIKQTPTATLLAVWLETGRTHQIRVHFSYYDHPLIGDPLYDPKALQFSRLLLHSAKMHLLLPFSLQPINIKAPTPTDFYPLPINDNKPR